MTLFDPPDSFEVLKVDTTEYGDSFMGVSTYFADPRSLDEFDHAANIFAQKITSDVSAKSSDVNIRNIRSLRGRAYRHDVIVAWGPAEKGLVDALRTFDEVKANSSVMDRWYFAGLLAALDILWD